MTIPSPDSRSDDLVAATLGRHLVADITLDQFRTALRRSAAARQHIGLDISDQAAAAIAADEALSAGWFKLWRVSVRAAPDQVVKIAPARAAKLAAEQSEADWQRELPMRFNPPPGWPVPSHDWILQHIGLDMADVWRPPGAAIDDPLGWQWWIPQDPAWSRWIDKEQRSYRNGARWAAGLFTASLLVGLFLGWTAGLVVVLAGMGIVVSAVIGVFTLVLERHFREDPMAGFRDQHVDTLGLA